MSRLIGRRPAAMHQVYGMMQVYCVDWKTLRLRQEPVEYLAESEDPRQHILRIQ